MPKTAVFVACLVAVILTGCLRDNLERAPPATLGLELAPVATGLGDVIQVTNAGDGTGRLYVAEQGGLVKLLGNHGGSRVVLDLRDRVQAGGEQGLLGIAFHPDFAANGFLFVHYSDLSSDPPGDTVLARFGRDALLPGAFDPASEVRLLTQKQPYSNHNGGAILFGPDGFLYMALGDGGSADDPHGNGQDTSTLLGKILRIDVDGPGFADGVAKPYRIPPGNPFLNAEGRDEIWAYGLRNPWRIAFDPGAPDGTGAGDLWVADVGQATYEEVTRIPAGTAGANLGWSVYEGKHRFRQGSAPGHLEPVAEYDHDDGCSVTGGEVYRGQAFPARQGTYLFGDYCSGRIWTLTPEGDGGYVLAVALDTDLSISSFGTDEAGEVYVASLDGSVHRVRLAQPAPSADGQPS